MTIEELREEMRQVNLKFGGDPEVCHIELDKLLLKYIGDEKATTLFNESRKWYA